MPSYSTLCRKAFEHLLGSFGASLADQLLQSRPRLENWMRDARDSLTIHDALGISVRFGDKIGRLLHPVAEKQMQDDISKSFHAGPWQGGVCKVKIKPGTIVNGMRASLQFFTPPNLNTKRWSEFVLLCPDHSLWMKHYSGFGLAKLERCLSLSCGIIKMDKNYMTTNKRYIPSISFKSFNTTYVWQCLTLAEPTLRNLLPQPWSVQKSQFIAIFDAGGFIIL